MTDNRTTGPLGENEWEAALEGLDAFEAGLDPRHPERSAIAADLIGYGEISAIFKIPSEPRLAYKRMPMFQTVSQAEGYADMYRTYCGHLEAAGISLPASRTRVIHMPHRPVVLYIAQIRVPRNAVAHRLLAGMSEARFRVLLGAVLDEMEKIREFNRSAQPELELAIDGQLSNWAVMPPGASPEILFLDTSTPLYRVHGNEQLDPELLLQAAPVYIRWLLRWLFVDDVLDRYYSRRGVLTDLVANLYKEQRADLIPAALETVNQGCFPDGTGLSRSDIDRYYREDKFIWQLFLFLRRLDRWVTTQLMRRRYEFILPGKIQR